MNICDKCQEEVLPNEGIIKDGWLYCIDCIIEMLVHNPKEFCECFDAVMANIPYKPIDHYKEIGMKRSDF